MSCYVDEFRNVDQPPDNTTTIKMAPEELSASQRVLLGLGGFLKKDKRKLNVEGTKDSPRSLEPAKNEGIHHLDTVA